MADQRDRVTVERDFDGVPNPDYPPKGLMMEVEERYGIRIESVEFPEGGRVRMIGWGEPRGEESLSPDMGGV